MSVIAMSGEQILFAWILFFIFMALVGMAARAMVRRRKILDTPTCKTVGVFIGVVELKGTAEAEQPLRTPFTNAEVVYHSWMVEEQCIHETKTTDSKVNETVTRHKAWETIDSGRDSILFYLKDTEGVVRVDATGYTPGTMCIYRHHVDISSEEYYRWGYPNALENSTGHRRFAEYAIPLHQSIYLKGRSRVREDIVAPEIAYKEAPEEFELSVLSEDEMLKKLRGELIASILFAESLGIITGFMTPEGVVMSAILFCGAGLFFTGYHFWLLYTSLVALSNAVKRAGGNLEVELKRRSTLIPQLVEVVKGATRHEESVQTLLAKLRAQNIAPEYNHQESVAQDITVVMESYPEMKSNTQFTFLQMNIVQTEQRIALARNFYNDTVMHFNNRVEMFPDILFAKLMGYKPLPYLATNSFEVTPIEVHLSGDKS